jgi:hypothetical protein
MKENIGENIATWRFTKYAMSIVALKRDTMPCIKAAS